MCVWGGGLDAEVQDQPTLKKKKKKKIQELHIGYMYNFGFQAIFNHAVRKW